MATPPPHSWELTPGLLLGGVFRAQSIVTTATFVGANKEMTLAFRAALRDPDFQGRTTLDNVTWHFMPPSAPDFGGL